MPARKIIALGMLLLASAGLAFAQLAPQARVSLADFYDPASPTAGIQAAVDALPASGGIVFLPAGRYPITRAIHLRSGVRIVGEGEATVIARRDTCLQVRQTASAKIGDTAVQVTDASGFRVGQEVYLHSDQSLGWYSTHAAVTAVEGNTIRFDIPLSHDHLLADSAFVMNFFPAFYGNEARGIVIENLKVEGGLTRRDFRNDFTVSAIHFRDVRDALVERVHVEGWPGDGIGIQIGDNATVTRCLSERNLGHGFHPGTGITSGSWTDNIGRYNGWDGFYFCHRVRHTQVNGNRFHDNGWNGIGGLGEGGTGGDRHDVVSGNFCYNNGRAGIECVRGGNNIVVNNVCENNSQSEPGRYPGILVEDTYLSVISGNKCLDSRQPVTARTQAVGILVIGESRDNVIESNILTGHSREGLSGEALSANQVKGNLILSEHHPSGEEDK